MEEILPETIEIFMNLALKKLPTVDEREWMKRSTITQQVKRKNVS